MSTLVPKRKNHYVPQFYLKNFASDRFSASPRRINLYNIPRRIIVTKSSIRNQCQKEFFYGETGELENALQDVESRWACLIRDILDKGRFPAANTEDHVFLTLLVSLQQSRTYKSATVINEMTDKVMKNVFRSDSRFANVDLGRVNISLNNAVIWRLQHFYAVAACLSDLKMALLRSEPSTEFITSDNPVYSYNLYCEGIKVVGTTGATQAGLLIFFPVSPEFCFLLYDGNVYKVGRPKSSEPVRCTADEVQLINSLQYMAADANLYFSGELSQDYFNKICKSYSRKRTEAGLRMVEAIEVGNSSTSLLHQFWYTPKLELLRLSFLSIRRNARRVPLADRINLYRQQAAWMLHKGHQDFFQGNVRRTRTFVTSEDASSRKP